MSTLWLLLAGLKLLLINTFFSWFLAAKVVKVKTDKQLIQRLFLQYLFCVIFVVLLAIYLGQLNFNLTLLVIFIVGVFNGYGCYSQWKATQFKLSAMALFTFVDDVIAICLGYYILKEGAHINIGVAFGLVICTLVVILFSLNNYWKKKKAEAEAKIKLAAKNERKTEKTKDEIKYLPRRFFFYALSFGVIWGFAEFAEAYFAFNEVEIGTFLSAWYCGSFATALILFLFKKTGGIINEVKEIIADNNVLMMLISSIFVMLNLSITYWIFQLETPMVIAVPIFFASAMIMPALVGIFILKEGKDYDKKDKLLFLATAIGALLIGLSFTPK